MMVIALVALLLAGTPAWASPGRSTARVPVTVRIYDGFGVTVGDITAARAEADGIFRAAGIAPVWFHCGIGEGTRRSPIDRCESSVGPGEIIVRLLGSPQGGESNGGSLGEALVNTQTHRGSVATVFADRVASTSDRAGASNRGLLGRVIAHEIGHLLIGTNQHARKGLMRAVWTDRELRRSVGLEWHFSAQEARSMRAAIAWRSERSGEPGLSCDVYAEQPIRQRGLRIHHRDARLAGQHSDRGDMTEFLDHARVHQRPEALRIGSDHETGDLPRHGDRQEAVEEPSARSTSFSNASIEDIRPAA